MSEEQSVAQPSVEAKSGIENLKPQIDLLLGLIKGGEAVAADGKISISDLSELYKLFPLVPPVVMGASASVKEWKDLDVAEAEALVAYVVSKGVSDSVKAQKIAEASLKVCVDVYGLVMAIKG